MNVVQQLVALGGKLSSVGEELPPLLLDGAEVVHRYVFIIRLIVFDGLV